MPLIQTKGNVSAQGYGWSTTLPERVYIEDVFSTWLYNGNSGNQTIENGIQFIENEISFTIAGTTSWIVPSGVTSISVVCIGGGGGGAGGGGGGGGGGLSYVNNLAVTPGETLTVVTGAGGSGGNGGISGNDGGASSLARGATTLVRATGGFRGIFNGSGGAGGTATTGTGFTGGAGGTGTSSAGGGGGGAAGYAGVGGAGGSSFSAGSTGSGGGGGGGGGTGGTTYAMGGGVGFLGQGANGTAGAYRGSGGRGGSGPPDSALYGGGGSSAPTNAFNAQPGGNGAVRIIWSGATRQFPTTQTSTAFKNNGLVWIKGRNPANIWNNLTDTIRGPFLPIYSNATQPEGVLSSGVVAFTTNGFSVNLDAYTNLNPYIYASWTFCEKPKFFDIVTYTGNGINRTIAHNLQSVPGCIIVKRTDSTSDWQVYHRSLANTQYMVLNDTAAAATGATRWNSTTPTSTVFSLGTDATVNLNGGTYVAYLFAHDAGGFGTTGADNVISCGSYTGNGSATGPVVTLGYEPQWLLIKRATGGTADWNLIDNMRGFTVGGTDAVLNPNLAASGEISGTFVTPTATGFQLNTTDAGYNASGSSYIYVAIRRGPMRTPTTGTSVFNPVVYTGTNVDNRLVNTTIAPDMVWVRQRNDTVLAGMVVGDRMRAQPYLLTGATAAEVNVVDAFDTQISQGSEYGNAFSSMNGFWCGNDATAKLNVNTTSNNHVAEAFRRAPGFFDVVCYTGTSFVRTVNHNLGVAPELMLIKHRNATNDWQGYAAPLGAGKYLVLNSTAGQAPSVGNDFTRWNVTAPTANVFTVSFDNTVNASGGAYIAYLFASCPGVSKVGSYTGTGATQTINCGFSAGARFVLIKRTDSTGDWYVWDSARGIVAANDPYLTLNSAAAEVTTTDWVDAAASGFELSNAAGNLVNINGASYIFLSVS